MSLVINEPITVGGQVPLLKHRIMQLMLQHQRGDGGHVSAALDTYWFTEQTKASPSNVNKALWDLQKQGLITFREAKRAAGKAGSSHTSSTVLDRLGLTPQGLAWKPTVAALADLGQRIGSVGEDDMDPAFTAAVQVEDVADDLKRDGMRHRLRETRRLIMTSPTVRPAQCTCGHPEGTSLKRVEHLRGCPWAAQQEAVIASLKDGVEQVAEGRITPQAFIDKANEAERANQGTFTPTGTPLQALVRLLRWSSPDWVGVREANGLLGYDHKSTAIYPLIKSANADGVERIVLVKGRMHLTAEAEGWEPSGLRKDGRRNSPHNGRSRLNRPTVSSPETDYVEVPEVAVAKQTLSTFTYSQYPLITALMEREERRAKVAEAVAALEAAGLDEDALTVLTRIPDDSPLEQEVIALVRSIRNG